MQALAYSGHYKKHGEKIQDIVFVDGMVIREVRLLAMHDSKVLTMSKVKDTLRAIHMPTVAQAHSLEATHKGTLAFTATRHIKRMTSSSARARACGRPHSARSTRACSRVVVRPPPYTSVECTEYSDCDILREGPSPRCAPSVPPFCASFS